MEDELRDPKNFLEYFLPRPIRLLLFRFSAASATLATLLTISRLTQVSSQGGMGGIHATAAALKVLRKG